MPAIPNELLSEINSHTDLKTSLTFLKLNKCDGDLRTLQLWTHQNSIGPLLDLLPRNMWKDIPPRRPSYHQCRHCKKLRNKEFDPSTTLLNNETIRLLASLGGQMKELVIPHQGRCFFIADIATRALAYIQKQLPRPLLRLDSLKCWEYNEDSTHGPWVAYQDFAFFQQVLGICQLDTLRRFDIPDTYHNDEDWVGKKMGCTGENLQQLRLTHPPKMTMLWRNTPKWNNLTSLFLIEASMDTAFIYRCIAPLASLEFIRIDADSYCSGAPVQTRGWSFRNLQEVSFRSDDDPLYAFLNTFETPNLRTIHYRASSSVGAELIKAIFVASLVLSEISITTYDREAMSIYMHSMHETVSVVNDAHANLLFNLPNLRKLVLDEIFLSEVTTSVIRRLRATSLSGWLHFESLKGWQGKFEWEDEDGE